MLSSNSKNSKVTSRDKSNSKRKQKEPENQNEENQYTKESGTDPAPDVQMQNRLDGMDQGKVSLDWFSFETRIRTIVYELLNQPMETVKKMMDRQDEIDSCIGVNKRRTDEHEFILYKFQKRADIEAEYESRISKMELDVKTQIAKTEANLTDLNVKLQITDRRSAALQDQSTQIQSRLDNYLSKLKDDIDKIASKNTQLFNDFMSQMKIVDEKYEQFGRQMSSQKEFFLENKQRYKDCLTKCEMIVVQLNTQEIALEEKVTQIRDEHDCIHERISSKEKQNTDILLQVVEMDNKFLKIKKQANDFTLKVEDELGGQIDILRKNIQVIQPINNSNQLFTCLQAICQGSQFNKLIDHQKQLHEKLVQQAESFDFKFDYDLQKYEIPPLPEKQAEDVRPRTEVDMSSIRSGASKLLPPRPLLGKHRNSKMNVISKRDKSKGDSGAGSIKSNHKSQIVQLEEKKIVTAQHSKQNSQLVVPKINEKNETKNRRASGLATNLHNSSSGSSDDKKAVIGQQVEIKYEQTGKIIGPNKFRMSSKQEVVVQQNNQSTERSKQLNEIVNEEIIEETQDRKSTEHVLSDQYQGLIQINQSNSQSKLQSLLQSNAQSQSQLYGIEIEKLDSLKPNKEIYNMDSSKIENVQTNRKNRKSESKSKHKKLKKRNQTTQNILDQQSKSKEMIDNNSQDKASKQKLQKVNSSKQQIATQDNIIENEMKQNTSKDEHSKDEPFSTSNLDNISESSNSSETSSHDALVDEECIRLIIEDYREKWLQEDEAYNREMMQEVAQELFEETFAPIQESMGQQAEYLEQLQLNINSLVQKQNDDQQKTNQLVQSLEINANGEQKKFKEMFRNQMDQVQENFEQMNQNTQYTHAKFKIQMKEAFQNFKISIELEQTKRMRQIGDLIANQQRILGQFTFNEKNYKIFQTTSGQICESMNDIVELIRLQNSLNFQEEKDKNEISLVSTQENEKYGAERESEQDQKAKKFMLEPSALAYVSPGKRKNDQNDPNLDIRNAHVEIETKCIICQSDAAQRHMISKAFKLACLKYKSGQVNHQGCWHERMKLIKIQQELIDEHSKRIHEIVEAKQRMEQTRDLADGYVPQNTKLSDYGLDMPTAQLGDADGHSNNMPNIYDSSEYNINTIIQSPVRQSDQKTEKAESNRYKTDRQSITGKKEFNGSKTMSNDFIGKKNQIISNVDQIKHKKEIGTGIQGDYGKIVPGYDSINMNLDIQVHQNKDIRNNTQRNNNQIDIRHPTQQSQENISTMKDQTHRSKEKSEIDMQIKVNIDNKQNILEKDQFMAMKNQVLTQNGSDKNIGQVNISVIGSKQNTYEMRKVNQESMARKHQFQPTSKSDFKFPNIERILQKELENSPNMNSKYVQKLDRTPTLEMKAGTMVFPDQKPLKQSSPGQTRTKVFDGRRRTTEEPHIRIKNGQNLINRGSNDHQVYNRNTVTVAESQNLHNYPQINIESSGHIYNKPAAPLVRKNFDSQQILLGRSGFASTQSAAVNQSAYDSYMHQEQTRSQSRGLTGSKVSLKKGANPQNYSYQSSIYDFAKQSQLQRPATQNSNRPSSVISSTSNKIKNGQKLASATSIDLRSINMTNGQFVKPENQGKNSMPEMQSAYVTAQYVGN